VGSILKNRSFWDLPFPRDGELRGAQFQLAAKLRGIIIEDFQMESFDDRNIIVSREFRERLSLAVVESNAQRSRLENTDDAAIEKNMDTNLAGDAEQQNSRFSNKQNESRQITTFVAVGLTLLAVIATFYFRK
jgi:hypothetical protein